jgi:hypothetical protein
MNKIFDVITITLLIVIANSSAMAATPLTQSSLGQKLTSSTPNGQSIVVKYES